MIDKKNIKEVLKNTSTVQVMLQEKITEFSIWPHNELDEWNTDYNVQENIPGFFAIGSDGGLEMLTVELSSGLIYVIPFIPMESREKLLVSDSLNNIINNQNTNR